MKNTMKTLVMAAAAGVLGTMIAWAADSVAVKANIPFDFVVANRHVPAGEYWFEPQASGFIRISSKNLKDVVVTSYLPAEHTASGPGQLVFQRYGTEHFLKSIDASAAHFGAVLPKARAEKEWVRPRVAAVVRVAVQ